MIHEIAPFQLDNSYHSPKPQPKDQLLIFGEQGLYCPGQDRLSFPSLAALPVPKQELQYLFVIGDQRFFRVKVDQVARPLPEGRWLMPQQLRYLLPRHLAFAAVLGHQLHAWYEARQYCGSCGSRNAHDQHERAMYCPQCGHRDYPSLSPAVIVGVIHGDSLLLTKYANRVRPHWALVAGYAEFGETLEQCVAREVMEETGLKVRQISYYKSQPWPFSASLLVGYYALVEGDATIRRDGNELQEAVFVKREAIDVVYEGNAMTNEMICAFRKYGPGPLLHDDSIRQQPFQP